MQLISVPKSQSFDLDKSRPPEETLKYVENLLLNKNISLLAENKRIDTGRLNIPVYMSICGSAAQNCMPTRKQMGKGATPGQAQASALMELVERYGYFSFWQDASRFEELFWDEAKQKFGCELFPIEEILHSVHENLSSEQAKSVLSLVRWKFAPIIRIADKKKFIAPLNWFKLINEFNGASAGNTDTESVLQGSCEVVERHVCAEIARNRIETPSIDLTTATNPILQELIAKFQAAEIQLILKDFSLNTQIPTIAALAWDPKTFPILSEIIFTAGTATSPQKAAIRALTEVAQLAGDFETNSNFEPSGLPKFHSIEETKWLQKGEICSFQDLPSLEANDFLTELHELANRLQKAGFSLYTADFTAPQLGLPSHYSFAPGTEFYQRTQNPSLGLFTAKILLEEGTPEQIENGLEVLENIYGKQPFLLFFQGMHKLQQGDLEQATEFFRRSETDLTDKENQGLAAFYQAYSKTQNQDWTAALPLLKRAIGYDSGVKEFHNLLGVCFFKQKDYQQAAKSFENALKLDSGSAMDMANLGLCHKFLGEKKLAKMYLQKALQLDSKLDFARNHLEELEKN